MRVVALKAWSNGSISMEERQIAELPDALATSLIEQGIVAPTALPEITDADDGKVLTADSGVWVAQTPASGGGVVVVHDVDGTLDKTWQEIHDADFAILSSDDEDIGKIIYIVHQIVKAPDGSSFIVLFTNGTDEFIYAASSASGYPALVENNP